MFLPRKTTKLLLKKSWIKMHLCNCQMKDHSFLVKKNTHSGTSANTTPSLKATPTEPLKSMAKDMQKDTAQDSPKNMPKGMLKALPQNSDVDWSSLLHHTDQRQNKSHSSPVSPHETLCAEQTQDPEEKKMEQEILDKVVPPEYHDFAKYFQKEKPKPYPLTGRSLLSPMSSSRIHQIPAGMLEFHGIPMESIWQGLYSLP